MMMIIKVNSLVDFESMLISCIQNGETSVKVFVSRKPVSVGTKIASFEKTHTKFTYVLFTHLYQVVFNGFKSPKEYQDMENDFFEFQRQNADFRIQIFENINVNSKENYIEVSKELNVL